MYACLLSNIQVTPPVWIQVGCVETLRCSRKLFYTQISTNDGFNSGETSHNNNNINTLYLCTYIQSISLLHVATTNVHDMIKHKKTISPCTEET